MAEVSFSSLPYSVACALVKNQRRYSPEQVQMARHSPVLIWVRPQNRGLPQRLRMAVFQQKGPHCAYCAAPLALDSFTVDHIQARAVGGNNNIDNLTVACRRCNSSKGAR